MSKFDFDSFISQNKKYIYIYILSHKATTFQIFIHSANAMLEIKPQILTKFHSTIVEHMYFFKIYYHFKFPIKTNANKRF